MNYEKAHNERTSRTLDSNPRASRQSSFSDILQQLKSQTLQEQREQVSKDGLLQGKFKSVKSNPVQLCGNGIIQMTDFSLMPANYNGVNATGLGPIAAARRAAGPGGGIPFLQGNSGVLRDSLVNDSGVTDPITAGISNQAHHIVEANDPNALSSRLLLIAAKIDCDSPINGVLLPSRETDDTGNATIHNGGHVSAYALVVHESLIHAIDNAPANQYSITSAYALANWANLAAARGRWRRESAWLQGVLIARLDAIRDLLLSNMVPINNSVDAEYDAVTNGTVSIKSIFRTAGIIS